MASHQPMDTSADPEQLLLAANWYEHMCIAAAKLSVAAGATPADARRVSGLRRVEIKRAMGPVRRQIVELDKAAVLAGDQIPRSLIVPERVLSECSTTVAADYLQISNYARYKRSTYLYLKAVNDLNLEFNKIASEFFDHKDQFRRLSDKYDVLGEKLNGLVMSNFGQARPPAQVVDQHVRSFSWVKRDRLEAELQSLVQQRDSLRSQIPKVGAQLASIMAAYQRHHARRAYLRSSAIREYSDYKSLFVPRATLYGMCKFNFDNTLTKRPDEVAKMLELADRWNKIQIDFAEERMNLKSSHRQDELRDHALFNLTHTSGSNSGP